MGRLVRLCAELGKRLRNFIFSAGSIHVPPFRRLLKLFSFVALLFLAGIAGALIMHFDLGPAEFLRNSFIGLQALNDRGTSRGVTESMGKTPLGVTRDIPEKTWDGFTLSTTAHAASAQLIDMHGKVVHEWALPFSEVWPHARHIRRPLADNQIHWFRTYLFPNGDLLAIYQTDADTPHGYGLVKIDKDSKLIWAYAEKVHHDLDVAADGRIYTLVHQIESVSPKGLDSVGGPYLADYLVVLSAEGVEELKIPIVEAFRDSPFSLMVSRLTSRPDNENSSTKLMSGPVPNAARMSRGGIPSEAGDLLHTNSVRVLPNDIAGKFPLFKPGQVLISARNINAVAVLDVPSQSITWAAKGVWRVQHDAELLDNGRLLLYDNGGSGKDSRVLEFDPVTYGYPWSYTDENSAGFYASSRGMKQHFPNGNVMIVDPEGGRIFEVTRAKELVWDYGCRFNGAAAEIGSPRHAIITGARRYDAKKLTFLQGAAR